MITQDGYAGRLGEIQLDHGGVTKDQFAGKRRTTRESCPALAYSTVQENKR